MAARPSYLSILNRVLLLLIVAMVCGTLIWLVTGWNDMWGRVGSPVEKATDVGRAVLGMENPRKDGVPLNEADARDIAAAVAIDSEGERVDLLAEAREEMIDIYLRTKQRLPKITYRQMVAKALIWVPDDFRYPGRWKDRNPSTMETGRVETVKELVPIVLKRMASGPKSGCAAKIIRAKWHLFGWLGGEGSAAATIRTYPEDPRFKDRGFNTKFHCLPKS